MVFHFNRYPKDNSLACGYMRRYSPLHMALLGPGFSTSLYSTPANLMKVS